MLAETNTVAVTVVEREGAAANLCVANEVVGTVTVEENFANWKMNEHGEKLGLDIPPLQVLSFVVEQLYTTLIDTVKRQLERLNSGSALLDEDRNLLYPELQAYLSYTSFPLLRHPLVYMVPYSNSPHEAVMANARFNHVSKKLNEKLAERNWSGYIYLHERPYRLEAFGDVAEHLDDAEYWDILSGIWTDSENINQNLDLWQEYWSAERPDRQAAMTEKEQAALAALPQTLTIYRGTSPASNVKGMSWTVTKRTAEWFGNRQARDTHYYLATAEVDKADVLAYLLGRNETEIVVLPSSLRKLRSQRVKIVKKGR